MDGAAHTVGQLGVQLGQLVLRVHAGVGDVSHGGRLHDVPDDELLDGLVLGAGLGAVGAPDELDMAAAMLVTSSVSALGCHLCNVNNTDVQVITSGNNYKARRSRGFWFVRLVLFLLEDQCHSQTDQHTPTQPLEGESFLKHQERHQGGRHQVAGGVEQTTNNHLSSHSGLETNSLTSPLRQSGTETRLWCTL